MCFRSDSLGVYSCLSASVSERGYSATTLSNLVEISGVSRRSLYSLFADKEACFQAAIEAILAGGMSQVLGAQSAGGAVNALLTQPAIITVPVAFAAMIAVSLATARPKDVRSQMLALHAPEGLGLEALERARA